MPREVDVPIVQFFENYLSAPLENIADIVRREWSRSDVDECVQLMVEQLSDSEPVPRLGTNPRALLGASNFSFGIHGDNFYPHIRRFGFQQIQNYLLYYTDVVVPLIVYTSDPLREIRAYRDPDDIGTVYGFLNLIETLARCAPLLRSRILIPIVTRSHTTDASFAPLIPASDIIKIYDYLTEVDLLGEFADARYRDYAAHSIRDDINDLTVFDVDYTTDHPAMWHVVRRLLAATSSRSAIPTGYGHVFGELNRSFRLPRMKGLSVADVVAIREHSNSLSEWRSALGYVLSMCKDSNITGDSFERYFQETVDVVFTERIHRIQAEISSSSLSKSLRKGFIETAVSYCGLMMADSLLTLPARPSDEAVKGGVKIAASAAIGVAAFIRSWKRDKSKAALLRHLQLFSEQE
jgi:hypothetical protein